MCVPSICVVVAAPRSRLVRHPCRILSDERACFDWRMRSLLALVVVLVGGCGAAGNVASTEQPIVGGVPTTGYPFVGYVASDYGGGTSSGCTGTLVRDHWVLTASHCIEESGNNKVMGVKVTFEADADHATVWHAAKSWQQHPNYGKAIPP